MGLISRVFSGPGAVTAISGAATQIAGAFLPNATRKMELDHAAYQTAMEAQTAEFQYERPGLFDRAMNGVNRMPRPFLALGTLGLFVYAMVDPAGFASRMVGLGYVPEPLWWLLGAIVSFYFGAREAYYFRRAGFVIPQPPTLIPGEDTAQAPGIPEDADYSNNAALAEWRAGTETVH